MLYESRAICRYLEEKYAAQGTPLIPRELKAKALFEQAASVEFANFEPYARAVYVKGNIKRCALLRSTFLGRRLILRSRAGGPSSQRGLDSDIAAFDDAVAGLSAKLDVYEVILGKQKFLAGEVLPLPIFHVSILP